MGFRYTLQSLLRVRQSLERREEQRLIAAAAGVAQIRTRIEEVERERLQTRGTVLEEVSNGVFGATLQFVAVCDAAAALACAKLQTQLAQAEHCRQEQLRIYREARQKREILEGLREQQEDLYDQQCLRRDQELADEAFLLHRRTPAAE